MTFQEFSQLSVAPSRILVQLDIGNQNIQWINAGAGIWYVNSANVYTYADLGLLSYFSAQGFLNIGSVQVDGVPQTLVPDLLSLTSAEEAFFYDASDGSVYVHLLANDNPELHTVIFGAVFGYSFDGFTPVGSNTFYEGRLIGSPSVSKSRDPLFFGRLTYQGGGVTLANGDGEFDLFGEENNVYGNEARILAGYDGLHIDDYQRIFTGYIEGIDISEEDFAVQISDKRKQLSKSITYSCTNKNALDAIVEIITTSYTNIDYSGTFFDIDQWDAMTENAPVVTIDMQQPDSTINIIQNICSSVFGIFFITPDNLFSFKIVNITEDVVATILADDILNSHRFSYDPTQVISSARIGYDRDWTTTTNPYTFYTNTDEETAVFLKYKTYNQKEFLTVLPDLSSATEFGMKIMDYTKDVHAVFEITTSMQFYYLEISDMVSVEVKRATTDIFGTATAEVIGVRYNLADLTMNITLRKLTAEEQDYEYRITEEGEQRETENGFLRILET